MMPHEDTNTSVGHEYVPRGRTFLFKKCHGKRIQRVDKVAHYVCTICKQKKVGYLYGKYGLCEICQHLYNFTPWDDGGL